MRVDPTGSVGGSRKSPVWTESPTAPFLNVGAGEAERCERVAQPATYTQAEIDADDAAILADDQSWEAAREEARYFVPAMFDPRWVG